MQLQLLIPQKCYCETLKEKQMKFVAVFTKLSVPRCFVEHCSAFVPEGLHNDETVVDSIQVPLHA